LRLKTDSIRASDLNLRIPVANPNDEIGQLTATINSLFARLEHAFDEIKRFSADASHELRTPIAIIRSEAEMVMQIDEEHSRTLGRMKSIVEECSRLTNLTTQLLALSRAESTKGNIKANSIHLASLLSEVVDSLSPQASLEGVRIEIRNADHTTCVWGDSESLRQVFYNLLDNALKYNRRNGSVVIESGSQDQKAIVVVSDTGIGIAAEYLPRVFDRFFRIPWEQSNRGGTSSELSVPGSGLGLSIVRQILYSHGGTCEIESEPGEGTRIRVSLPLA
jgi:signal transduction histidine kinase